MRKTFYILTLLFFACGFARAESDILNVALKAKASLNVETVRLRDLVDTESTDLGFIKSYGNIKIDVTEDTANIDHSTILAALMEAGADLKKIRFLGNASVVLERGQKIDLPGVVAAAVTSLLNSNYGVPASDVEVKGARVRPALPSTDMEGLKFSGVAAEDLGDLSRARFSIIVQDESGERSAHTLFLNLAVETSVASAAIDLEDGQTLMETDYVAGRTPLKTLTGKIVSTADLKGRPYKVLENVRKDGVLTAENVAEIQQIKKGSPVTLLYKTGMLRIQATGTLADDAEIGATVRVENSESKRTVTGRLVAKDEVEVGYAN